MVEIEPRLDKVPSTADAALKLLRFLIDKKKTDAEQTQALKKFDRFVGDTESQIKTKSKNWFNKATSDDSRVHNIAESEIKRSAYKSVEMPDMKPLLDKAAAIYKGKYSTLPDWLPDIEKINNPVVAEATARLLMSPESLINDSSYVYVELGKAYASMKWAELPSEQFKEVRQFFDKAHAHVRAKNPGIISDDILWKGYDRRFDLYRTQRIEIPKIGDEPQPESKQGRNGKTFYDRKDPDFVKKYNHWKEESNKAAQAKNLDSTLLRAQRLIDNPNRQTLDAEIEQLRRAERDIQDKMGRFGNGGINEAEGTKYLEKIWQRKSEIEPVADALKAQRSATIDDRQRHLQAIEHIRETGQGIIYDQELVDRFHNSERKLNQTLPFRETGFTKAQIEMFRRGRDGWSEYAARFRVEKSQAEKPFRMDLNEKREWDAAKDVMRWLGGEEQNDFIKRLDKEMEDFEQVDGIIKSVDFGTKQDIKEYTRAHRYLSKELLDALKNKEYANLGKSHLRNAMLISMGGDFEEKRLALEKLLEERDNPFDAHHQVTNNEFIDLVYFAENDITTDEMLHKFRTPVHASPQKLAEYRTKYLAMTPEQRTKLLTERKELTLLVDRVGLGVLLRDDQMKFQNEHHRMATAAQEEVIKIDDKLSHMTSEDPGRAILILERARHEAELQRLWKEVTRDKNARIDSRDIKTMSAVYGMSPIEIEARFTIIDQLRYDVQKAHPDFSEIQINEVLSKEGWKINEAIRSARQISIGMGEAMELGAKFGRCSSRDLRYILHRSANPKHFMNRGWAEQWQRGLNPNLFEDDFGMGGPMGDDVRNLEYSNAFRKFGYDYKKDKNLTTEYKDKIEQSKKQGIPEWVILAEYAEEILGIPYSEVVRPEALVTGLQQASTGWRQETIGYNMIRKRFFELKAEGRLPEGASLEHHGLVFQIAASSSAKESEVFLDRLIRREPLEAMSILGDNLAKVAGASGVSIRNREWGLFQRSLSIAQTELWRDINRKYAKFDFTDRAQFDEVMPSVMKSVFGSELPRDQVDKYFHVICNVRDFILNKPEAYRFGSDTPTRLSLWAKNKFGSNFIFGMSQVDWKEDVDFTSLGGYSLERRINDYTSQFNAANIRRDIFFGHPEQFLFMPEGKEGDSAKKLLELWHAIIDYSGPDAADTAVALTAETIVDWNINRAAVFGPWGWIPGAVTLMRNATDIFGGVGTFKKGAISLLKNMPGGISFVEKAGIEKIDMESWPQTLKEMVSYDVKWGGRGGNRWTESRAAGYLETLEELKLFTTHDGHLDKNRLFGKYHASFPWRLASGVRAGWPALIVATIAVAAMEETQKKTKSGGSSH
ncbi:hypothetical protein HY947_06580 [Candidatus Gottesmanbacteria bacterium]|nr:hypothetical protein [Candidatus Gottesmanbacteria bacterium]